MRHQQLSSSACSVVSPKTAEQHPRIATVLYFLLGLFIAACFSCTCLGLFVVDEDDSWRRAAGGRGDASDGGYMKVMHGDVGSGVGGQEGAAIVNLFFWFTTDNYSYPYQQVVAVIIFSCWFTTADYS